MIEVLRIIGLILFSSVKFLFAPSTVYLSGYNYWQTLLITIVGGILGVTVFFYTGSAIFSFIKDRFSTSGTARKTFSKKNRFIIRIKASWGILGVAMLSPCLLSIPLGSLIAARYFRYDRRTLPMLIGAVVFWSLLLTTATALIGPLFE
ncbi:MAG: hypothetical protein HQ500_03805 [Flavobacteriales bacterium]|nr:hypothetical protein [Flavobacteriales bacterium]